MPTDDSIVSGIDTFQASVTKRENMESARNVEEIVSQDRRQLVWAIVCAALLIAGVAVWLALRIPNGILTYPDELFTAERSREMLILGRGSVHFNFHHTFAKPPLQYWLTSFTLSQLANPTIAVRVWPLVYGVLTAIAVGWLAFLSDRTRPWLIPLSIALFVSCPLFSTETTRALLDTGLVFFTTLAIAFAQLARRRPVWWLAVAVACWLGALQKIPIILLLWLVIVLVRLSSADERPTLRSGWLVGSAFLAVALVFIWPVLQLWKYGMPLTKAFAGDDLNMLLGKGHLGSRPYFEVLDGLVVSGWAGGGLAALLAALAILFYKRRETAAAIVEMSILSVVVIILAIVFNFRSVRYVLPVVPWLSVVLAFVLHQWLEQKGKLRALAIALVVLVVSGGFIQAAIKMHHRGPDASREQQIAQKLGLLQREGEVTTLLVVPTQAKRELRSGAFYLFHGNLSQPLVRLTTEEFRRSPPRGPVNGVCLAQDFPAIQSLYSQAKIELTIDQFICWQTQDAPPR